MKRIDYDDPGNDNDITLFKFYSSFARVIYDLTNEGKENEVCELLMAAIKYSTSFENEEEVTIEFSNNYLKYIWATIRPNIGKSAKDLARCRRKNEVAPQKGGVAPQKERLRLQEEKGKSISIKDKDKDKAESEKAYAPTTLDKANLAIDGTLFVDGKPQEEAFDIKPPASKGAILDYMQEKGYALEHLNVERFWNYYTQRKWLAGGVPVIWKQKVDEWVADDQIKKITELEEIQRKRANGR